jgi:hypothetical protein
MSRYPVGMCVCHGVCVTPCTWCMRVTGIVSVCVRACVLSVCIVSVCIHIHPFTHTHTHTHTHTYMHTHTHTYDTCIHTYIHTYMHAYIHTDRHAHTHTHTHTHIHTQIFYIYFARGTQRNLSAATISAWKRNFSSFCSSGASPMSLSSCVLLSRYPLENTFYI